MNEISNETPNSVQESTDNKTLSKYSIVLRFWNTPQEIEVTEFVGSVNRISHQGYIKFFDSADRLWTVPESDVILIRNFPDKEDVEDFQRLKKEVEEMNKKMEKKEKIDYNEVG